jgi:protein gp37
MSDNSKIEWTTHTFNPWWGCSRVSPGCVHCYADDQAKRYGHQVWRRHGPRRMLSEQNWARPLKWNRDAERDGKPAKVFCASMADVFEDHPDVREPRKRLWGIVEATPWLTWQLLTKRPENVTSMVPWGGSWPRNVWVGASTETQRWANARIPHLLKIPATVLFLSAEPLLGPINLIGQGGNLVGAGIYALPDPPEWDGGDPVCQDHGMGHCSQGCRFVDWVIIGGESGPKARPMELVWARSLARQCEAAQVPVFCKQLGATLGRELGAGIKGGDWDAWPADLCVRDFPDTVTPVTA